jgi:hypothetical protein
MRFPDPSAGYCAPEPLGQCEPDASLLHLSVLLQVRLHVGALPHGMHARSSKRLPLSKALTRARRGSGVPAGCPWA